MCMILLFATTFVTFIFYHLTATIASRACGNVHNLTKESFGNLADFTLTITISASLIAGTFV